MLQTALMFERRIEQCGKLVVLATDNALDSRWVVWEIGVAHSTIGRENVAIIVVGEECATGGEPLGRLRISQSLPDHRGASVNRRRVIGPRKGQMIKLSTWLGRETRPRWPGSVNRGPS